MNFGLNLKQARESAGITQASLAEKLGVRQKDISRWERNDRTPNVITFRNLCEAIGVSADEMLEIKI